MSPSAGCRGSILVYLRTGLIHEALGVIYEVRSSTIGRAIGEVRPLLAERGFAVPQRPGRAACVSDERKQDTIKTTTISHGEGRTLWCGAVRPGRMHDQTAMRTEGIAEQFRLHPQVKAEVDEGYRGQRVPRPGERSAPQAEEPRQRIDHRTVRLAAGQAPPILPADRRRIRQCRAGSMAPLAALDWAPSGLRRDTLRDRRPGL